MPAAVIVSLIYASVAGSALSNTFYFFMEGHKGRGIFFASLSILSIVISLASMLNFLAGR